MRDDWRVFDGTGKDASVGWRIAATECAVVGLSAWLGGGLAFGLTFLVGLAGGMCIAVGFRQRP